MYVRRIGSRKEEGADIYPTPLREKEIQARTEVKGSSEHDFTQSSQILSNSILQFLNHFSAISAQFKEH